jgi:dihydroorotase
MRILIENAQFVDANGHKPYHNLLLQDGVIAGFDLEPGQDVDKRVDAAGKTVTPAFIDPHAHLREPGQTHKEDLASGLAAALAGGFATVVCMPNTSPVLDSAEAVAALIERAKQLGLARLLPAAALTVGQKGQNLSEAAALKAAGAVMLTDDGRTNEDGGVLKRGLEYAKALGLVVSVHAEDASLRGDGVMNEGAVSERLGLPGNPIAAESARIARDLELVALTDAHLHVQHLSSARGLALVRAAKAQGLPVTCEVTPHHLTLTDQLFESERFFCDPILKVAPPLRTQADADALLLGLLDGTVDCLGTDHAPHTLAEKQQDMLSAPFGIANIEITFPLLYSRFVTTGKLSLPRLLELLTVGPAKVLKLTSPLLEVGCATPLVLLDLTTERPVIAANMQSKAKFSPWEGEVLQGWPVAVVGH